MIRLEGVRILANPNSPRSGDHVHLGLGCSARRRIDPAVDLHEFPPLNAVLMSHYNEDHFDKWWMNLLIRNFPCLTMKHGMNCLVTSANVELFRNVWDFTSL